MLSILTLNIGAASSRRAELILEWLSGRPEDVFILTETSAGDGTRLLLDRFRGAGYSIVAHHNHDGDRGVALVSRVQIETDLVEGMVDVTIPIRVAGAVIRSDPPTTVLGLYVPSRDASLEKVEKKHLFIDSVLAAVRRMSSSSIATTVVGGDYNVIPRHHRPLHPGYLDFEFGFLDELERLGLTDAQAHVAPNEQVYSWVGRTGAGYKYDYFHAGPTIVSMIERVEYISASRELGFTDHSAVSLEISGITCEPLSVCSPLEPAGQQASLF